MSLTTYIYNPFQDSFYELDHVFDAMCNARVGVPHQHDADSQSVVRVRMDLHESKEKNEITATFELPGMKKEDIIIDVHNNRLTVSGQSISSNSLENEGYALRERRFGRFARSVKLPVGTKAEEVKASMDNGVLTVTFPRTQPEQEGKKIVIS